MTKFPCSKLTLTIPTCALLAGFMMNTMAAPPLPSFSATDFIPGAAIDNPYFPLVPGTTMKFLEKDGIKTAENLVEVTQDSKTIGGVKCVVVHDTLSENGALTEDTYDWYAQAKDGTVWYFGEDTKEFKPGGQVDSKGSWEAGVKGAQAGIIMPGVATPGKPYRQEYLAGEAEDMGQVVALGESVTVPAGTFTDVVRTKEWSMLESGSEKKWYARGVGVVREEATAGEVATLISITTK